MRPSEELTFDVAPSGKNALCNQEGGAVSKDIFLKSFQNIRVKTWEFELATYTDTLTKCN
jgi:hypothetical protein